MDINKLIPTIVGAGIISFVGTGIMLYTRVSSLELRADYIEKKLEDVITADKLENAKLQISQQITTRCNSKN